MFLFHRTSRRNCTPSLRPIIQTLSTKPFASTFTSKMPTTELAFSDFKQETAKEAIEAVRAGIKIFKTVPGNYLSRVGHILKHNGDNVASKYNVVLAIGILQPLVQPFIY
jgi:hypothetical protein